MTYKEEFIRFMVDCGVLTFGSFTLKSGRQAPYFINTGNYKTGKQLAQLGKYYAACMKEHGLNPDTLFGPAYKGIPLATSAAVALATEYDRKSATASTERKSKTMAKAVCLSARSWLMVTRLSSSKML